MDILDRIGARVNVVAGTGCWEWLGAKHGPPPNNYCTIGIGRIAKKVHRVVFEECYGNIPFGLEVRHTCDNPPCCRPDHLVLGTHTENMHDASTRGRMRRGSACHLAKLNESQVQEILRLLSSGSTTVAIGRQFGIGRDMVSDIKTGKWWRHVNRDGFVKCGEKLNEIQVREIRALLSEGLSMAEIARRYGVWPNTIKGIAIGKTWRHLA